MSELTHLVFWGPTNKRATENSETESLDTLEIVTHQTVASKGPRCLGLLDYSCAYANTDDDVQVHADDTSHCSAMQYGLCLMESV